jgi:hypothetical protein
VRRTLPALLAAAAALCLIGLAIATDYGSKARASATLAPAPPRPVVPAAQPDAVPDINAAVLAEMTRRLGTPRAVLRTARLHARAVARQITRARARQRAEAARRAAAAAAAHAAAGPGYWVDSQATAVNNSAPTSPTETAWLQGGYGGWVEPSGMARAPYDAPPAIKSVIAAGNQIARAPYIWGGGHGAWLDKGYDCSGSVSFALAAGGMLSSTETSGQLMNWGVAGPGRWLTIYANKGHVFMYVAGLRFDTSGRAGDHSSRWQLAPRTADGFVARHYPGL